MNQDDYNRTLAADALRRAETGDLPKIITFEQWVINTTPVNFCRCGNSIPADSRFCKPCRIAMQQCIDYRKACAAKEELALRAVIAQRRYR